MWIVARALHYIKIFDQIFQVWKPLDVSKIYSLQLPFAVDRIHIAGGFVFVPFDTHRFSLADIVAIFDQARASNEHTTFELVKFCQHHYLGTFNTYYIIMNTQTEYENKQTL